MGRRTLRLLRGGRTGLSSARASERLPPPCRPNPDSRRSGGARRRYVAARARASQRPGDVLLPGPRADLRRAGRRFHRLAAAPLRRDALLRDGGARVLAQPSAGRDGHRRRDRELHSGSGPRAAHHLPERRHGDHAALFVEPVAADHALQGDDGGSARPAGRRGRHRRQPHRPPRSALRRPRPPLRERRADFPVRSRRRAVGADGQRHRLHR
jgi:hypothetical protein